MSAEILGWSLLAAQLMLAGAIMLAAWRMVRGPRAQDRVLGLDTFNVAAMLMLLVFGIRSGSSIYFEAACVIALVGFAATVALSKFLMRGEVIE